jgi:molybdate transport system ATP-binding protein
MALEVMARADGPIPLDVAFRVEPGELLALVGNSGSGKSTLLRTIAGLWRPERARVSVGGTAWLDTAAGLCLAPHQRRVGMVFQAYGLFPHMTALANVAAALDHLPRAGRSAEARRLLALVNLGGLEGRRPAELSGGQQQRVAIARALARKPEALLLDEPFSAVDRATREALYREIRALRGRLDMPVVLVTHDIGEAQFLADRIVVIEAGRAVFVGPTDGVLFDPAALRTLGLREAGAVIAAHLVAQDADGLSVLETSAGRLYLPRVEAAPGTRLRIRIHANDVILSRTRPEGLSALNILPGTVETVHFGEGPGALVQVRSGTDLILARLTRRSAAALGLAPGVPCHAILKTVAVGRGDVGAGP